MKKLNKELKMLVVIF